MSFNAQHLYELLPVLYRLRDAEQGEPLRALLSVIAEQVEVVEDNLDLLYDDLFIETCADWVIPYIGDLIGYRALHGTTPRVSNRRAEVANTIAYRRRKGTAYVLGLLAQDVTGWPAHVVEYFRLLGATQYMKHLRPFNTRCDVHSFITAEDITTGFDLAPRTVDVRRIASGRGRHNIPNLGIFVWRLRPYTVHLSSPRAITSNTFTFDPLGLDIRLFNPALTPEPVAQISDWVNLPAPLSRRRLFTELEQRRQAIASSKPVPDPVYFTATPPFTVYRDGAPIPSQEVQICNLSAWTLPDAVRQYAVNPLDPASSTVGFPIQIAVDPQLGRIAFPATTDLSETQVEVDYTCGFSGDYGAGPYPRPDYQHSPAAIQVPGSTLAAALATLGALSGIIEIDDNHTYPGNLAITLAPDQKLTLRGADRTRPVLDGKLTVTTAPGSALILDDLLISGGISVEGRDDLSLTLAASTTTAIAWVSTGGGQLVLDHTLSGKLQIDPEVHVILRDSAVDGGITAGQVDIARSTVIGAILARETELIENSILTGKAKFDRTQSGCVRFTWLPLESVCPRRYECQPNTAIQKAIDAAKPPLTTAAQAALIAEIQLWLIPVFTETTFGKAAYLQLHKICPREISQGADDGSEMGVFHDLFQPQRLSNLTTRLDEYLRVGLEAGILAAN